VGSWYRNFCNQRVAASMPVRLGSDALVGMGNSGSGADKPLRCSGGCYNWLFIIITCRTRAATRAGLSISASRRRGRWMVPSRRRHGNRLRVGTTLDW